MPGTDQPGAVFLQQFQGTVADIFTVKQTAVLHGIHHIGNAQFALFVKLAVTYPVFITIHENIISFLIGIRLSISILFFLEKN